MFDFYHNGSKIAELAVSVGHWRLPKHIGNYFIKLNI